MVSERIQPGVMLGRYIVEERLGEGSMGAVFRVSDPATGRQFAVKVMTIEGNEQAFKRFEREAEAMLKVLGHPNVLKVHETGEMRGMRYLVLDLAGGGDLSERLRRGPLDSREVARLGEALARGLAHVHDQGILHRDLKPDNVLFDDAGNPQLSDFGVARLRGAGRLTQTGQLVGTLSYMSPEQMEGEGLAVDERTDVYGLAAVLYHAATGQPPYEGPMHEVMTQITLGQLTPPREVNPDVSPDLERVLLKALSKAPDDRYVSAGELAEVLGRVARGERLEGGGGRAALLVGAAALLVVGLGVGAWAASRPSGADPTPSASPGAPTPSADPELAWQAQPPARTPEDHIELVLVTGEDVRVVEVARDPAHGFDAPPRRPRADRTLALRLALEPGQNRFRLSPQGVGGRALGEPLELVVERFQRWTAPRVTNLKDGSVLVRITAASFHMGLPEQLPPLMAERQDEFRRSSPRHEVRLTRDFYLGEVEVTWAQYSRFCAETGRAVPPQTFTYSTTTDQMNNERQPHTFQARPATPDYPVFNVTWFDAAEYCEWAGLRLPTEAEWALAARGPEDRLYPWGNETNSALTDPRAAVCVGEAPSPNFAPFAKVGTPESGRTPAPFRLANMAGNVSEWCSDWAGPFTPATLVDPRGPKRGAQRVLRGGSWDMGFQRTFTAFRAYMAPSKRSTGIGLRVARDAE
ncbi:MAG: bifunctional serine/threonine-protein kinase/formylglycine-generating enzyme family protein [Planctomycetota bacterium]